jgi:hypothetical protein
VISCCPLKVPAVDTFASAAVFAFPLIIKEGRKEKYWIQIPAEIIVWNWKTAHHTATALRPCRALQNLTAPDWMDSHATRRPARGTCENPRAPLLGLMLCARRRPRAPGRRGGAGRGPRTAPCPRVLWGSRRTSPVLAGLSILCCVRQALQSGCWYAINAKPAPVRRSEDAHI